MFTSLSVEYIMMEYDSMYLFENDCILQSHQRNFENSANIWQNRKGYRIGLFVHNS